MVIFGHHGGTSRGFPLACSSGFFTLAKIQVLKISIFDHETWWNDPSKSVQLFQLGQCLHSDLLQDDLGLLPLHLAVLRTQIAGRGKCWGPLSGKSCGLPLNIASTKQCTRPWCWRWKTLVFLLQHEIGRWPPPRVRQLVHGLNFAGVYDTISKIQFELTYYTAPISVNMFDIESLVYYSLFLYC